jgi:hypothetical protein
MCLLGSFSIAIKVSSFIYYFSFLNLDHPLESFYFTLFCFVGTGARIQGLMLARQAPLEPLKSFFALVIFQTGNFLPGIGVELQSGLSQ